MAGQVPPLQSIVETDDDLEARLAGKGLKGETCSQVWASVQYPY